MCPNSPNLTHEGIANSVENKWSPLTEILGRYVHNAYHAGQISKLALR